MNEWVKTDGHFFSLLVKVIVSEAVRRSWPAQWEQSEWRREIRAEPQTQEFMDLKKSRFSG